MPHAIYRIVDFKIVGPYTVWIKFDDGAEQVIDFLPVLEGELYGPLRDENCSRRTNGVGAL